MRFAEPFKIAEGLSPEEKLEAERLMFLELTQGDYLCVPWIIFRLSHLC